MFRPRWAVSLFPLFCVSAIAAPQQSPSSLPQPSTATQPSPSPSPVAKAREPRATAEPKPGLMDYCRTHTC